MSGNGFRLWRIVICLVLISVSFTLQPEKTIAQQLTPSDVNSPEGVAIGYLSIPAAAFHPTSNYYDYENSGGILIHRNDPYSVDARYFAAVFLPHGTTLSSLTFFYNDFWTANGASLSLVRVGNLTNSETNLTSISSSDSSGCTYATTTTFSSTAVDNFEYIYYLSFGIPDSSDPVNQNVYLCGALIEYEYSLPLVSPNYLNIPAAAFTPFSDNISYQNWGNNIYPIDPANSHDFQAPAFLPDGAYAEAAIFFYEDSNDGLNGEAHLSKTNLADSWSNLANLNTMGFAGIGNDHVEISPSYLIDNQHEGYWSFFRIPTSSTISRVTGKSLRIRYIPPDYYRPIKYVVIPAAAFIPWQDGYDYENHGRFLKNFNSSNQHYVAPVYLPEGKYVRKMTFYYNQIISSSPASVLLNYSHFDDNPHLIASIDSTGSGWTSRSTTNVSEFSPVDNYQRTYWLTLLANTSSNVWPAAVVIELTDFWVFLPALYR